MKRIELLESDLVHIDRAGSLLIGYQLKMADQGVVRAAMKSRQAADEAVRAGLN